MEGSRRWGLAARASCGFSLRPSIQARSSSCRTPTSPLSLCLIFNEICQIVADLIASKELNSRSSQRGTHHGLSRRHLFARRASDGVLKRQSKLDEISHHYGLQFQPIAPLPRAAMRRVPADGIPPLGSYGPGDGLERVVYLSLKVGLAKTPAEISGEALWGWQRAAARWRWIYWRP